MDSRNFSRLFFDNLLGSSTFEILKLANNILLMGFLSGKVYGLIGTLFALLYFAVRVADAGTAYAQAPFFNDFIANKYNFIELFIKRYLGSVVPFIAIIAVCTAWFVSNKVLETSSIELPIIIFLLVVLETIRSILRQFFHTAGTSRSVIIAELIIFIFYLASLWGGNFFLGMTITPALVFMLYIADSLICFIFFMFLLRGYYVTLPQGDKVVMSEGFVYRTIETRIFYWLLRITQQLFTSNMITPLFALRFGLKQAGIFYFASTIARSIYAIVRSAIGHPGNALFAQLKHAQTDKKQDAFKLVSSKLFLIIIPIVIFFGINYYQLFTLSMTLKPTTMMVTLTLLYLLMTLYEAFSLIYEQFYILEEATPSLFAIKFLEAIFFYYIIFNNSLLAAIPMLIAMITIRSLTFFLMALNAYLRWGIKPQCNIKMSYVYGCIGVSAVCLIVLRFLI